MMQGRCRRQPLMCVRACVCVRGRVCESVILTVECQLEPTKVRLARNQVTARIYFQVFLIHFYLRQMFPMSGA